MRSVFIRSDVKRSEVIRSVIIRSVGQSKKHLVHFVFPSRVRAPYRDEHGVRGGERLRGLPLARLLPPSRPGETPDRRPSLHQSLENHGISSACIGSRSAPGYRQSCQRKLWLIKHNSDVGGKVTKCRLHRMLPYACKDLSSFWMVGVSCLSLAKSDSPHKRFLLFC
jgi:hypothetical protein